GAAGRMDLQLRPERRDGSPGDRAHRGRARREGGGRRSAEREASADHIEMSVRRRLFRWGSWFAVVNVALLAIVGLRYLWYYSALTPSVAWVYAVLAYVGQFTVLGYLPFLLLTPVIALLPKPQVIVPLGIFLAGAAISFLVLDSLVFAENRYHLDVLTFVMFEPPTWAFFALYFLLGLAIEAMLAVWIWRRSAWPPRHRVGRYLVLGLGSC